MRPYEVILNEVTSVVTLPRFVQIIKHVCELPYPVDCNQKSILDSLEDLTDLEKYELGQLLFRGNVPEAFRILSRDENGNTILSPNYKRAVTLMICSIEWNEDDYAVSEHLSNTLPFLFDDD